MNILYPYMNILYPYINILCPYMNILLLLYYFYDYSEFVRIKYITDKDLCRIYLFQTLRVFITYFKGIKWRYKVEF